MKRLLIYALLIVMALLAIGGIYATDANASDEAWENRITQEVFPYGFVSITNEAYVKPMVMTDHLTGKMLAIGIKIRPNSTRSAILKSTNLKAWVYSRDYPKVRETVTCNLTAKTMTGGQQTKIINITQDGGDLYVDVDLHNLLEGSGQMVTGLADFGVKHRIFFGYEAPKTNEGWIGGYLDITITPDGRVELVLNSEEKLSP